MTVCDRSRKELKERAVIERYIKITGYFVIFSETGVLCKECWNDFKQFMNPDQKPPKEEKDG